MREKVSRHLQQISDLQVRKAVQQVMEEIIDDLEDHKAKFDAHTHSALDTAVVSGQQFQEPNLKK